MINSERKNNASLLLTLLKDEGIRWNEQLTTLRQEKKNFLGNIIVSAMFISYLSPFTGNYRKKQVNDWIELCKKYNINIMAVKEDGKMNMNVTPDTVLTDSDTMLVLGKNRDIQKCFHL